MPYGYMYLQHTLAKKLMRISLLLTLPKEKFLILENNKYTFAQTNQAKQVCVQDLLNSMEMKFYCTGSKY